MKKTLSILLLFSTLQLPAQWLVSVPEIPDTVGLYHIDALDENVAWANAIKWTVTNGGYSLPGHDKGYYLRTEDGGQNWITGTVPMGDFPYFSNVCAMSAQEAWMSGLDYTTNESFIVHTTDGGQNWERVFEDGFAYPTSYINAIHFWDDQLGIAIGDPATDDALADPYFEIYRTGDGGDSWNRVHRDSFLPADPSPGEFGTGGSYQVIGSSVWFPTTAGKLFYSDNGGQSWTGLAASGPVNRFSFADEQFGVLNTQSDIYQTTENGGLAWTTVNNPALPGYCVSLVAVPETHYLLAVLLGAPVSGPFRTWLSKDGGETWQDLGAGENACVADAASPTAIYAGEWQPADHPTRMYRYNGESLSGILSGRPLEAEVEVYPNPASNFFLVNVKIPIAIGTPADFLLLVNDAQGRLVERQVFEKTNAFNASLDVHHLPAGVYTLTISTEEGMVSRQFAKQ